METKLVYCYPFSSQNIRELAFVREYQAEHRQKPPSEPMPITPPGELVCYAATEEGPQHAWFLCTNFKGGGNDLAKAVIRSQYPERLVDPKSIGLNCLTRAARGTSTRQARKLVAAQYYRGLDNGKRPSLFRRLVRCLS